MSRTRSLSELRADVCDRADVVEGTRHTTAQLNRYINQAIQQFRRLVTDAGCTIYIAQSAGTTSTSSTPDAANWAPRDYIAMPNDFYHLCGIDIISNGSTFSMLDFVQLERNIFKMAPWLLNPGVGMPVLYKLGGANAAGSRVAKVIPSADSAYNYTVWYVPKATDLVADIDTFDGIAGYEEWVVNRAAMDALLKDSASQAGYQAIAMENARLERSMIAEFGRSAGPGHRVDSKALKARLVQLCARWWR